ncbi:MAG: DUF2057 family protein [Marinobacter sp.]|uniref:DUF2057 family protein n=1 Tax=Marinobacter sp. AC-23 TaxID=1879031 RepID=UPI0009F4B477
MSSIHAKRVTKFEIDHSRRWLQTARAMASAVFLLVLAGCSSAITKLETWEGSPATAANAATLKAPGVIHVSQVNGRSMTNYLMDDLALDYALLPGDNQVVFTYKTIWAKSGVVENGESKVHVIESEPQVVRFDASPNETYHFEFDKPDSRQKAEKMMPEFSAAVVGANGQALAQSSNWSPGDSALVARTPALDEPGGQAANDGAVSGYNTDSLKQLKAVWETATDEERKAFLRWAFE